jgi:hypothetical protein
MILETAAIMAVGGRPVNSAGLATVHGALESGRRAAGELLG